MSVLVSSGEARQALSIVRSLGSRGIDIAVLGERGSISFFSRYCKSKIIITPANKSPTIFLKKITKILKQRKFELFIPITDKELSLVSENRETIEKHTKLIIPSHETLEIAQNKYKLMKFAETNAIPHPKSILIKNSEELKMVKDFPVVIKPQIGYGSRGVRYAKNPQKLIEFYKDINREYKNPLVQEYIPGGTENSYGFSALCNNGNVKAFFIHKRIFTYPIHGGPSALAESSFNPEIKELGSKLLKNLKWNGIAMVEFKIDSRDGKPKLMEINPRFWGSLQLAVLSGVDFPYLFYKLAMKEKFKSKTKYKLGVRCLFLFPSLLYFSKNKRILLEFLNPKNHIDILSYSDLKPAVASVKIALSTLLSNKKREYYLRR